VKPYFLLALLLSGCAGTFTEAETKPNRYVQQYLQVQGSIPVVLNPQGETQAFTAGQITEGQAVFESNCKLCHVGGNTLQNPKVSLSLLDLKQATPPRDNLNALVSFIKVPRTYDGKSTDSSCRGGDFLKPEEQAKLAAFVLRAADRAKGWGTLPQPEQ